MDKVQHFEIPVDDIKRGKDFYEKVFDWKIDEVPGGTGYYMIYTSEVDEKFMPKEPGCINGGMYAREDKDAIPTIVVTVSSVKDYLDKIKDAGGSIVMEPKQVMDMGIYAMVKDTERNLIGIWENLKKDGGN